MKILGKSEIKDKAIVHEICSKLTLKDVPS